jgi:hypothetical protein
MTTRIVQANKAELSFGNRPHPSEPMSFSVAIGCPQVPDFSVISVRQIEFLRTTGAYNSCNRACIAASAFSILWMLPQRFPAKSE